MPDYSQLTSALGGDFDPEHSRGRFNRRLAVAVVVPEYDWESYGTGEDATAKAVEAHAGAWLLEEEGQLGRPRTTGGSVGRGAEGWIPVVEWVGEAVAEGTVQRGVAAAAARVIKRLRRTDSPPADQDDRPEAPTFYISRGMAAALAADDVGESFGDNGPLEVEAVEEPSSIMGVPASETSYVGIEPWIVVLRNVQAGKRYYVVVAPDGVIMGHIETPILEWEKMYLRPVRGDEV